ncbi:MAG: alcohol dehydrogenase (cytochrome c), partial [Gammaproteobacteria bacterium]
MKYAVLSACLSVLVLQTSASMAADYSSVTKQRLSNPEDANWLMYRRTYDGWGYSPLDQITTKNVKSLRPAWSYSTGVREGHQAP